MFFKKGALQNFSKFTGKHLRRSFFFNKAFLRKLFSCEFCKIFQSTFITEQLRAVHLQLHKKRHEIVAYDTIHDIVCMILCLYYDVIHDIYLIC